MSDTPQSAYRPAVVTFVDILGFRELVATRSAGDIRRIIDLVRRFGAPDTAEDDVFETTRAVAFSDSIIRVRAFDTPYPSGALFHELLDLVHMQAELVPYDVLLRGGVSVGEVHLDGDIVFGPGFTRAYDLESQFANFPRIVVGPEAFQALRSDRRLVADHHDVEDEILYQRNLLRRGDDGFWFVDYLYAVQFEVDEPVMYPRLLQDHRSLIIARANAAAPSSRVLQKHLWLARYHNSVCERVGFEDQGIGRADIAALEDLADTPAWAVRDEEDDGPSQDY